jgi:cysteine desulfurase family protein (TIGR01976 family)
MSTPVHQKKLASQITAAPLDSAWVRSQFPSLQHTVNGHPAAFLDGPAGTQVPRQVMDAFQDYFLHYNANSGGVFETSRRADAMIAATRSAMADLLNCSPEEISFGPSMTTVTFAFARAFARDLQPGDEIVVTTLDHDANVSPWRALEERGVVIRQVDIRESDCTLDLGDLKRKITSRTKLVAVGYASNAVGTINPVAEIIHLAHAAGALAFIDAVHYAPHASIDVRALDCDFLACSPYKFFGPHSGVLYGKKEHMTRLKPYKVRPASDLLPDRWETGTLVHECLAGIGAAVDYLAELGRRVRPQASTRREALLAAYAAIRQHEKNLSKQLIAGLLAIPGLRFFGISDPAQFENRVGTVSVRLAGRTPTEAATFLGERGIFTWDGNYYALNLVERLGFDSTGGMLRIGLVHYNTAEEVDRLLAALREFASL